MTDQEFLELLNLYIDHEIGADDAARLESAVAASPRRREIYKQYCRMQKACSQLSDRFADPAPDRDAAVDAIPYASGWRFGPLLAGVAAACILAVVGVRFRGALAGGGSPAVAASPAEQPSVAVVADVPRSSEAMEPVFSTRFAPARAGHGIGSVFASASAPDQLNWIGDIHLAPVAPGSAPDYMLPRGDLKAAMLSDSLNGRDDPVPAEMAAFRFQR